MLTSRLLCKCPHRHEDVPVTNLSSAAHRLVKEARAHLYLEGTSGYVHASSGHYKLKSGASNAKRNKLLETEKWLDDICR